MGPQNISLLSGKIRVILSVNSIIKLLTGFPYPPYDDIDINGMPLEKRELLQYKSSSCRMLWNFNQPILIL